MVSATESEAMIDELREYKHEKVVHDEKTFKKKVEEGLMDGTQMKTTWKTPAFEV